MRFLRWAFMLWYRALEWAFRNYRTAGVFGGIMGLVLGTILSFDPDHLDRSAFVIVLSGILGVPIGMLCLSGEERRERKRQEKEPKAGDS